MCREKQLANQAACRQDTASRQEWALFLAVVLICHSGDHHYGLEAKINLLELLWVPSFPFSSGTFYGNCRTRMLAALAQDKQGCEPGGRKSSKVSQIKCPEEPEGNLEPGQP